MSFSDMRVWLATIGGVSSMDQWNDKTIYKTGTFRTIGFDVMMVGDLEFVKDSAINRTRRTVQLLKVLLASIFNQFWIGDHDLIFVFHCSNVLNLATCDVPYALVL